MGNGAQCVTITGISTMPMWYVVSWASLVQPVLQERQNMVRGPNPPGWITSIVAGKRHRYFTVLMQAGELKTAIILRMQVWSAPKLTTALYCECLILWILLIN